MHLFRKYGANLLLALLLGVVPLTVQASREEPIVNVSKQSLVRADGKPLTAEQVKNAIILAGARQRDWSITPVKDGLLNGRLSVRGKHFAGVDITYSNTEFSITYRESTNLLYGKDENGVEQIHRNYNRWIQGLRHKIVQAVLEIRD